MPRLTYNSIDIDVDVGEGSLSIIPESQFFQNRATSGKIEQINQHGIETYTFDAFFDLVAWRKLYAWWWGWASLGKPWSFAMDSDKTGSTTLDGAAAAGQTMIPLTSTTGFSIYNACTLSSASNDKREVVIVTSMQTGVSIYGLTNLIYTYASGDSFRHNEYFPSVINTKKVFDWRQAGDLYSYQFQFIEVL